MTTLTGKFEVTMQPQSDEAFEAGRLTIDKTYAGDVTGQGMGQMLSHMTEVKGSAGYVAVEKFSGTVRGKKGSFVLLHTGVMDKGEQSLLIQIVPDSGSEELKGISGDMGIDIKEGQHFYTLNYQFA